VKDALRLGERLRRGLPVPGLPVLRAGTQQRRHRRGPVVHVMQPSHALRRQYRCRHVRYPAAAMAPSLSCGGPMLMITARSGKGACERSNAKQGTGDGSNAVDYLADDIGATAGIAHLGASQTDPAQRGSGGRLVHDITNCGRRRAVHPAASHNVSPYARIFQGPRGCHGPHRRAPRGRRGVPASLAGRDGEGGLAGRAESGGPGERRRSVPDGGGVSAHPPRPGDRRR
jgi:hypothetical protein